MSLLSIVLWSAAGGMALAALWSFIIYRIVRRRPQ